MNSQRTLKGILWSGIDRFSVQLIQFIISIVLARLLAPSDFGLVAIILVVMNLLQTVNEGGFTEALLHKLDRDNYDFSSVFIFNILFGVLLYSILYLGAPIISYFFELADLTPLIRVLGLNIVISSFIVVQRTRLFIKIDFKTQAQASLAAVIISGIIGIYCAYLGLGVKALIIQSLLGNGINTLLIWLLVKWRPVFYFSYERFIVLFRYAYKLILARLINNVFQELYSLLIGKIYSPSDLGFFNRARSFEQLSSNNITSLIQRVSTPLLCQAQNNNNEMKNILTKFIQITSLFVFPLLCGLFVLAEPLIIFLLTEKWLPSVWILKALCPVGLFYVLSTFNRNVFNATGRTDLALQSEIIKKIIFTLILVVAIYHGFRALIYSQILLAFIELIVDLSYTKKQTGLTLAKQFKSVSGILVSSIVMALLIKFTISFSEQNIIKLLLGIGIGAPFYFIICYSFNISSFRSLLISQFKFKH